MISSTYIEVLGVNVGVLGQVVILLSHENTLFDTILVPTILIRNSQMEQSHTAEEVLVDELAVSLWN